MSDLRFNYDSSNDDEARVPFGDRTYCVAIRPAVNGAADLLFYEEGQATPVYRVPFSPHFADDVALTVGDRISCVLNHIPFEVVVDSIAYGAMDGSLEVLEISIELVEASQAVQ